jgi:hypothetical protein
MAEYWKPEPMWAGEEAYCIGGGPSLRTFDWELLRGKHTVGCNVAFRLGHICEVCLFGDTDFFAHFKDDLMKFQGMIVSNLPALRDRDDASFVRQMRRRPRGIGTGDTLAWNGNTGAAAINLAVLFGATKVYLLGYDMMLSEGRPNWHDEVICRPNPEVYNRFIGGFQYLAAALKREFPQVSVVNLTDVKSRLALFPRASLREHFDLAEVCDGSKGD